MASSKGQTGNGIVFSIGGPAGGTGTEIFSVVGETRKLPFKIPMWESEETTNFQNSIRQNKKTIKGITKFTVTGVRVANDPGQIVVQAAYQAAGSYDFKIQFPPNTSAGQTTTGDLFAFAANVLSYSFADDLDPTKIVHFSVDVELTSDVTFTAGS